MGQKFLLCPPDYFTVEYAINPYMDTSVPVDRDKAQDEWQNWKSTLESAGATVEVQPAVDGLPDIVFTNNSGFVCDGKALLSRFRYEERRGETPHNSETFERLGLDVEVLPEEAGSFEGAAEAVLFNGHVIVGYGQRTGDGVPDQIAHFTGLPSLPVHLHDPRFYHLDVVLCPLDDEQALVVPAATDKDTAQKLLDLIPNPLVLDEDEAGAFCANSVVVGDTVFMHEVPSRVGRELEKRGFNVQEVPVGEFMKAGGALKCMSLRLDESSSEA